MGRRRLMGERDMLAGSLSVGEATSGDGVRHTGRPIVCGAATAQQRKAGDGESGGKRVLLAVWRPGEVPEEEVGEASD